MKEWKLIGVLLASFTATNAYAIEPISVLNSLRDLT